jgi:hypothetical protein
MPATVSRLVEHFVRVIEGSETFLSQLLEGVRRKALQERQIAWDKNVSQVTAELSLFMWASQKIRFLCEAASPLRWRRS